jgi:hypothetical protein
LHFSNQYNYLSPRFVHFFIDIEKIKKINEQSIGIATEMIKARISMLKFYDLKLTSTGFASIGAQVAAKKAGCVVDYEMRFDKS